MAAKQKLPFPQLVRAFWSPYVRLLQYLAPYKKRFVLGLLFGVLAGMVNGGIPAALYVVGASALPKITAPAAPAAEAPQEPAPQVQTEAPKKNGLGGIMKYVPLPDASQMSLEAKFAILMIIPLVIVARGIFSYLNAYCLAWVSLRVLRDIRRQLFSHLMSQSMGFFSQAKSGKLISRVTNDTRVAQNALVSIAGDLVKSPVAVVTNIFFLIAIDWKFSLTTLVLFPICIIPVVVFGRKVRQAGKAEENEAGAMSVILQETFAGIRVVKSFAREDYQVEQFDKSSEIQCRNSMRVRKSMEMVGPFIESVSAVGVVLAMVYVYFFQIDLLKFGFLCTGLFMLYEPVKALSKIPMQMQKCMASASNIFDLLKLQPAIQDAPDAATVKTCEGRITFEDVTFSYGRDKNAVHEITLDIEAGKQYALVGESGAGKSTMLALIQRFYDPQQGTIKLDGRDIRSVTQDSLREQIGVVTQDTFLFHDTIIENIRYGRLEATDEEIFAAAKLAYAHDFILAQPEGYNTVVGDKGCLLSGGQQQRLAIARALLKNAPILLLDEATSALDSESEKMIQVALERLAKGRTVISIAHRLSTILKSDKIVVMDKGHIVASGTHSELMASSTLYRRVYEMQFHNEELGGVAA